ncbi:MAG: NUDIX domain-containing protein [Oscillospiraceae bacterium]|nr:NUDIX domain-containing protein [Oscillospiraceae bacterium]
MDGIFEYEHPFVCTDAAVFTIKTIEPDSYRKLPETILRVLLYQRAVEPHMGKWCLPGGFLSIDELPEDNIRRKISEKSRVDKCWLEQLYTFCDLDRDPRARVISITYLGLMEEAESAKFDNEPIWFTVRHGTERHSDIQHEAGEHGAEHHNDSPHASGQHVDIYAPELSIDGVALAERDFGFDHYGIIKLALERLRSKIIYTDIIFNLLPREFTLTQMQNVYEAILGKKDQPANFRRKIMDMVSESGRHTADKGHRPAKLYTKR